ncbi:MAG: YggT family protein, partial [Peptococcaceae bacterium]|nr:YggT family protein [Peptococcaceae bacterium]
SWFPRLQGNLLIVLLNDITEPLIKPFRRIPLGGATGMIDFSPIFALIALIIIRSLLSPLYNILARIYF